MLAGGSFRHLLQVLGAQAVWAPCRARRKSSERFPDVHARCPQWLIVRWRWDRPSVRRAGRMLSCHCLLGMVIGSQQLFLRNKSSNGTPDVAFFEFLGCSAGGGLVCILRIGPVDWIVWHFFWCA